MRTLRRLFPWHIIYRFSYVNRPPRSSHLSVCDFFSVRYSEIQVYANRPANIQKLNNNIQTAFEKMMQKVIKDVRAYIVDCITYNGGRLMDIIYKNWLFWATVYWHSFKLFIFISFAFAFSQIEHRKKVLKSDDREIVIEIHKFFSDECKVLNVEIQLFQ